MTLASMAALADGGEAYVAANTMILRNTRLANFLECCALSLSCGRDGEGRPAGLMLMAPSHQDNRLLRLGRAIEIALG